MLETLRRISKGWIMKIILGLLALTFVVFFGSTDFGGRGGGSNNTDAVVEVDDINYSLRQISREFNLQLQQISRASGRQINLQDPIASSLLTQTINTMVTRSLYDLAARDIGVVASDNAVQNSILDIEYFKKPGGEFNAELFTSYLGKIGMSEEQFFVGAKQDLKRSQFLGSLRESISVPDPMIKSLYKYRNEKRIAEILYINPSKFKGLKLPDETQIRKYYEKSKNNFQSPEYRNVTVASLSISKLAAATVIDEQEVIDSYNSNTNDFMTPERRKYKQGIFLDKESAVKAMSLLKQGSSFSDAVNKTSGFPPTITGPVSINQIGEEVLAEKVFSTAINEVNGPIESSLGWHLILVESVIKSKIQPLSSVKEPLKRALSIIKARDNIINILNDVEDSLAAGLTIEEVARENKLTIEKLDSFDAVGLTKDNKNIVFEPIVDLVRTAYSTSEGETSNIIETSNGGFFVIRNDKITPKQIKPLNQIRQSVIDAWIKQEQKKLAIISSKNITNKVSSGKSLKSISLDVGGKYITTQPFDRMGRGEDIEPAIVTSMFKSSTGDVVHIETSQGAAVARLTKINKVNFENASKDAINKLRTQLAEGLNRDLAEQLIAELKSRYSVDVNKDVIEDSLLSK